MLLFFLFIDPFYTFVYASVMVFMSNIKTITLVTWLLTQHVSNQE